MGENVRAVKCMQMHSSTCKHKQVRAYSEYKRVRDRASACGCWLRLRVYVPMPVVEEVGEILNA
eukprot:3067190-Pleurochrysis_carterae.AAC.1